MSQGIWPGNLFVEGTFQANQMNIPANAVGNAQVSALNPLAVSKYNKEIVPIYAQSDEAAVVDEVKGIHIARASGTVVAFRAALATPNIGAATVVIDLLKNGVSILSSTITLDSTAGAYDVLLGTIAVPAYVAADVFEVSVDATVGGGTQGQGLVVQAVFNENVA